MLEHHRLAGSIFGIILLFLQTNAFSQTSPDSLNLWVKTNLKKVSDTANLYKKAHEALSLSRKSGNTEAFNEARRNLSTYHEHFGQIDSAIYYMEQIRDFYKDVKDTSSLAETYLEIKGLNGIKADYAEAANQVFAALDLYEKSNNKQGIANCYTDLCDLLYYEDKYQESVDYCDKAIAIQKEIDAQVDLARTYRYKASSLLFIDGQLENALATINKAIDILKPMKNQEVPLMASINGRGNILKYMGRYDEAIADYRSNYEKSKALGLNRYTIPSLGNIGHVYLLQEKYKEALPYNLEAIDIIKASGDTKNLWENYMHVRDIYEHLGNYKKAFEYSKLFSGAYSDYLESIIDRLESEAQIKYETAQKDAMIKSQEATIVSQRKVQILYIAIAAILLISLAGMLRSRQRIRKKQKELERSQADLQQSLTNLKAAQQQLIHAEKMASLGELTAGIAHEIQNPLNFVNNFSEVNSELINEMREELEKGNYEEIKAILEDFAANEGKIIHHGKRADSIVKGMLQHSRASSNQKESTDINALADEYLRLAFHGMRARDKSFQLDYRLDAYENLPEIKVVPQDIGRVLLNLINNAFHAVNERNKKGEPGYNPTVTVTTRLTAKGQLLIAVKDNGPGIPNEIKDKIFQPFFTTKPTGEGTGLGLSLSYDIITKGHGGEIKVESNEGEGTEFTIVLPIQ